MIADLHIHTTASDGQYSPSEMVRKARGSGIECMAITDHDTVEGVAEAFQTGKTLGVRVIRGVELSAKDDKNLHILGYNFSPEAAELKELCLTMKNSRDKRKYRIIDYLKALGVEIPLEEVEQIAGGDIIGRPHFAQVMVKHGYVSDTREAFDKYLDAGDFQRIERIKFSAEKCIGIIRRSGGRAVLAHPWQLLYTDEKLDALVSRLADCGLEGIECFYPRHTKEQQQFYLSLTKKYGLHVTGGSDFHGERVKPDVQLATYELDVNWLIV